MGSERQNEMFGRHLCTVPDDQVLLALLLLEADAAEVVILVVIVAGGVLQHGGAVVHVEERWYEGSHVLGREVSLFMFGRL